MGLDMYLEASKFISGHSFNEQPEKDMFNATVKAMGVEDLVCEHSPFLTVKVTVAYWRKANAIHNWFVVNCQNGVDECQETLVQPQQLMELADVCRRVLEDPKLAEKLLPPQGGFFFGSTEIDDWYFQDLKSTISQIDRVLSNKQAQGCDFYYQASW